MPVPVPVSHKQPTHFIIKKARTQEIAYPRHSIFQHLKNSLPLPPSGPPPAFATRQEWINSLPSWRRNKPRRIWEEDSHSSVESSLQGFETGLAAAGNAAVIKGAPAQAGFPPVTASTVITTASSMYHDDADDELSPMDEAGWHTERILQFTDEDDDMGAERDSDSGSLEYASGRRIAVVDAYADGRQTFPHSYERGVFSPVLEDISDNEPGSSPIGPTTPFADFVDRAVRGPDIVVNHARSANEVVQPVQFCYINGFCGNQCYQCQHCPAEQAIHQIPPAPEPVVTPTASVAYRKLAEPLAEWMVSFVWKVCTTGMSLPPQYAQPT
jgi:hypothetical protein